MWCSATGRVSNARLGLEEQQCRDYLQLQAEHALYYLVSPVSFLNANPKIAIFLSVTVLNKLSMIREANLLL